MPDPVPAGQTKPSDADLQKMMPPPEGGTPPPVAPPAGGEPPAAPSPPPAAPPVSTPPPAAAVPSNVVTMEGLSKVIKELGQSLQAAPSPEPSGPPPSAEPLLTKAELEKIFEGSDESVQVLQQVIGKANQRTAEVILQTVGQLIRPALEMTVKQQIADAKVRFAEAHADLKDQVEFAYQVAGMLKAQGRLNFNNEEALFKAVADETRKLLAGLKPSVAPPAPPAAPPPAAPASTPPRSSGAPKEPSEEFMEVINAR